MGWKIRKAESEKKQFARRNDPLESQIHATCAHIINQRFFLESTAERVITAHERRVSNLNPGFAPAFKGGARGGYVRNRLKVRHTCTIYEMQVCRIGEDAKFNGRFRLA